MKKICYITTVPITIQSFLLGTIEYIHRYTDWDISIICDYDSDFEKQIPEYIHYYPVRMKRGVSLSGIKATIQMRKIFYREKFDLIQYSTPNASLYAAIAGKLSHIAVRNYHLMGLRYLSVNGVPRKVLKLIEKLTCKFSTNVECVSNSNLQLAISEHIFPKDKGIVIWNGSSGGIDLKRYDVGKHQEYRNEIRQKYKVDMDDFVFLFVGRITRDKGINEIFEAFLKGIHAKLILVGSEENTNSVNQQLYRKAKKNMDIIFCDFSKEVEKFYCAADVLLFPSYREGFGNVVMEAAAMGTPAIVSDIPGPTDASIEGETAIWIPAKNSEALYSAMIMLLNDKQKVKQMGERCVDYVSSHFEQEALNKRILEKRRLF